MEFAANPTIVVVGLGYVGLPLAVALAKHFTTIGYDIDAERVAQLVQGHDRTGEIATERLMGAVRKCDIVCCNCHRVRTYLRRQGLATTLAARLLTRITAMRDLAT